MSYFGKWEYPKCGRQWIGGIGWTWPKNLPEFLEKIFGCTNKKITEEELAGALVRSCA